MVVGSHLPNESLAGPNGWRTLSRLQSSFFGEALELTKAGAKVLDFGLAKSAVDPGLTVTGHVMGTPACMAPERLEGRGCQPNFESGTPQALFDTDMVDTAIRTGPFSWDIAPDGKRFLNVSPNSAGTSSLNVLLNWRP